jgi:phosphate transport system substrate-binding protein
MTRQFRAAVSAALFLFAAALPGAGSAQDVTLTSRDGSIVLDGTLLGFDGEFYRVDTIYGELTVDGSGVLCDGPGCPDLTAFVASLNISTVPGVATILWPALVEAFARQHDLEVTREDADDRRFAFRLTGGADGRLLARLGFHVTQAEEAFADLLADEADVIAIQQELDADQLVLAADAGLGDLDAATQLRVLSLDALVPVVALGNPVQHIDIATLAQVFSGQIDNWAQLGGPDAPVALHLRNAGSGLGQVAAARVLAPFGATADAGVIRHADDAALASAVAADPFAIGLASYARTGDTVPLAIRGACGFELRAGRQAVKAEDYPLTAPVFLYLPARRLPKVAREFLAFLHGPTAQRVVRRAGFVDQAPETVALAEQGDRLRNAIVKAGPEISLEELQRMMAALEARQRLTVSFRFRSGSSQLDGQSRSNVQLLARALEGGTYDGRGLLFVGFSDGDGPAELNRRISVRRAEAVRKAVIQAAETLDPAQVDLAVDAFGEALPMACDTVEWGRQVNRRVEVWVR